MCVSAYRFYLQYHFNVPLQIVKQVGHYNSFKQFSNFFEKGESVPSDAFSWESKTFFKR